MTSPTQRMALSPNPSKKLDEPYLMSHNVLSIVIFAFPSILFPVTLKVAGNVILFVIPLMVKSAVRLYEYAFLVNFNTFVIFTLAVGNSATLKKSALFK